MYLQRQNTINLMLLTDSFCYNTNTYVILVSYITQQEQILAVAVCVQNLQPLESGNLITEYRPEEARIIAQFFIDSGFHLISSAVTENKDFLQSPT